MLSLKQKTVSGLKWTTVATVNNTLVQILKLFILARLLEKSDFGLIAIVLMILGFTEIFSNLGLSIGLIHKQEVSQKQYSSVFWVNLSLSIVLYLFLVAMSPLFADFYAQNELKTLIPLMGVQLIINAFGKMFYTFKTKNLEFKFLSIVSIVGIYIGTIVTLWLAWRGYGVYSLVYGLLVQSLVTQVVYAVSGLKMYRILLYCNLREIMDLIKIGGFQVGTQVLDYVSNKLDIFLIGRFFGMELLGVYNLAKELIMKPIQVVNPIITNVATPSFAKFQDNLPMIQENYLKVIKLLSVFNFPIFICFAVFAEPIVLIIYGQGMMEVTAFVRILAFWGLFNSIGNPAGILMVAKGRTDLGFYWTVVRIVVMTVAMWLACQFTIFTVAYAQTLIAFAFLFLYWRMMVYNLSLIPLKRYIQSFLLPLLIVLIVGAGIYLVSLLSKNIYFQLALIAVFGILVVAAYWIFDKSYLKSLKTMVLSK
ncbi:MAG: MOP flippase family protein [Paludibacteraceae bacterium]|jgi:O-antigen/teichoic acid export membrane protein|nr:MOP flippase family protein [Paludibacteraceae bacterium]HHT60930.1 MOP flippase family protein [Bacteroidales bacterium]MBP9039192.1 MOP flippase family protein [Paludibacteraceae bacterium]HOO24531.1 MOP flippase family protein [Paludibacteraceae bacterium]HPB85251.1 MOP flippase family protein [Paludibacteraceae bacterium]